MTSGEAVESLTHMRVRTCRKLLEVQNDIKEALEAITDVVNYDDSLQSLCLTERAQVSILCFARVCCACCG